jgi:formylmethanofuran dehydrogenase subunit D
VRGEVVFLRGYGQVYMMAVGSILLSPEDFNNLGRQKVQRVQRGNMGKKY